MRAAARYAYRTGPSEQAHHFRIEVSAEFAPIQAAPQGPAPKVTNSVPECFALLQNTPNPVSQRTDLRFQVAQPERVMLAVYNLNGEWVTTLVQEHVEPGYYSVTWNGTDNRSRKLPAGVYIYRLEAGSFLQTRRLILLP